MNEQEASGKIEMEEGSLQSVEKGTGPLRGIRERSQRMQR